MRKHCFLEFFSFIFYSILPLKIFKFERYLLNNQLLLQELVFNLAVNFPSKEWLIKYQEALNGEAGKAWQEAAKDWEGDFLFVIEADDKLEKNLTFYIDLWHGECRRVEFIEDPAKAPQTEFQYRGKYSNWVDLIHGKIDPIKGIKESL